MLAEEVACAQHKLTSHRGNCAESKDDSKNFQRQHQRERECGSASVTFREAVLSDATELATVQVLAWQHHYKGVIHSDYLDSMSVRRKRRRWQEILDPSSQKRTLLLLDRRRSSILGYATVGLPHRHSRHDVPSADVELYTLYLSANCPTRRGFGSLLYSEVIENLGAWFDISKPSLTVVLWCLADNKSALKFYRERCGFQVVYTRARARFGDHKYPYWALAATLQAPTAVSKTHADAVI